jgi:NAD-reducing hydrogenase large subunit
MHTHWARLIEILHAAEMMKILLNDPDLQSTDLVRKGKKTGEGVGLLEAPRGTLFHHYRVNDDDQITMCNLIVSTTNNNEPMNRAVNGLHRTQSRKAEITEGLLNGVEVVIRAYDPCLSCATHAMARCRSRCRSSITRKTSYVKDHGILIPIILLFCIRFGNPGAQ